MFKKICFLIFTLLCSAYCFAVDLQAIPALTSPVMDTAHLMNPSNAQILNNSLLDYYNKNGTQMVILTIDDIYPENIFDYSVRVMDTWKIGRKDIDDGVLILIVKNIRKANISVGRGLEGAIPDAYAKRIIEQTIRPAFKIGDFDTGIINAIQQIQKLIADEKLPSLKKHPGKDKNSSVKYFFMFLIVFPWIFNLIFGRTIGSILLATSAIFFSLSLGVTIFFCILIGIGFFCFGYFFDKTNMIINTFNNNNRWFGGGFGGGFGGKGGGGGFSGGGGGFGGGGASGGW